MPDLSVSIAGAQKLDALATQLRNAGRRDLERELRVELRKPPKQLERAVKAAVPPFMPRGYEAPLARSLRFMVRVTRGAVMGVRVTMHGRGGGGGDRDVRRLNQGELRHPVFGRRRRTTRGRIFNNPWVVQRIPPGFFTKPAAQVLRQVQDDTVRVIDRVLAKIGD